MTESSPSPLDAYRAALQAGRLQFQRCRHCAHAWLPPRPECPNCLRDEPLWEPASGLGEVVSWVVYRRAYDPSVAARVPYNVALVALREGPCLLSNIVGLPEVTEISDRMAVRAVFAHEGDVAVVRFVAA